MKKFLRIIFILILVYFQAPAQYVLDTTKLVKDFTIDLLGQCYAIQGREIIKLDINGSIISTYSNKDFGNPSALDARDPLRLIVFYRDFSMIRILDSRLAVQSQLDLRQLGFLDVRLIAGNADQSIWVYDRTYSQLSKIDVRLQKSLLTVDLRQFLGKSIVPKRLELSQNWIVLLNDSDIILLDQYGTYSRTIPLNYTPTLLQLDGRQLLTGKDEDVEINDLSLFNSSQKATLKLPNNITKAMVIKDKIWYLKDGKLTLPSP